MPRKGLNVKRKILLVAALLLASLAVAVSPAQAADPKPGATVFVDMSKGSSPSPATAFYTATIYSGQSWTGSAYTFNLLNYNRQCVNFGASQTDYWYWATQSVYHNSTGYTTFYKDWGCGNPVTTTATATQPWKKCNGTGGYGPWYGGCGGGTTYAPSSMYVYLP